VQAGETPAAMRHVALQVPATFGDLTLVDHRFVDVAHQQGLAVHVWTIEEETEMERLCDLGVDGIITDRPTALVSVLERLGCSWRPKG
jgi:glycerophosphoryl diester phosphodiesterase